MSTNMIECPICNFHYSATLREHCPTCGAQYIPAWGEMKAGNYDATTDNPRWIEIVVAHGAERARQLPQSPRVFQLVD